MVSWQRAHWCVGAVTLAVFPLSGAYMLHIALVPHLEDVPRLVFRSRHLFLMISGVANLAIAAGCPRGIAGKIASSLVLVSPFLLIAAFLVDPARGIDSSEFFRLAMFALFGAGVLLAICNRPRRKPW